jgi:hypothetical protein
MVGRGALVAAAVAVALLSVASAPGASQQPKLALLPLPKSALGQAGRSLSLAADSGADSNAHAAAQGTGDFTAEQLKHLGRVSGYLLDYGSPFSDTSGVSQIQTEVEQYKSPAQARRALAFWRKQELDVRLLKKFGLHVAFKKLALSDVHGQHWAYLTTLSTKGLSPLHGVDAQLLDGDYLLDVNVAGSPAQVEKLVPALVRKLDRRLRLAQSGRLQAKSVTLPHAKPGPPAHGPKPAQMVLTRSDVGKPATIRHGGYVSPKNSFDEYALSAYDLAMAPAGSFGFLQQEVSATRTAVEVRYFSAVAAGAFSSAGIGTVTPVDLSSVGDNAFGEILQIQNGAQSVYEALIVLSRDKYLDFLSVASKTKLAAADVQSLAQKAAQRLNGAA